MIDIATLRSHFLALHTSPPDSPTPGILVMPNPWDIGSARLLVSGGALALATTSAGHAASQGRLDQNVRRDEAIAHADEIARSVDVPVSVDAEDCFADDVDGVAETASLIAATAAAGFSIEDYDPRSGSVRSIDDAAARVAAAKADGGDLVLTARADGFMYGLTGIDETIDRLAAFQEAGADVVYAPAITDPADISRVLDAVDVPVNVLAVPGTPTVPELAALGVARVSLGSMFSKAAYGALVSAAAEVFGPGTHAYASGNLTSAQASAAFESRPSTQ